MKYAKRVLCVVGSILILSTVSAIASEATDIMKNAFKYVGSLDKYTFNSIVSNDDIVDNKKVRHKHQVEVRLKRPDKFRIDAKGDVEDRSIYLNNGIFTMIDHGYNYYGKLKIGKDKNIDTTLDFIFEKYGVQAPLAQLLYSDMHSRSKIQNSKYFGKVTLGGVECDYVTFWDKEKEIHVWVVTGDKPLIKRFIIVDKTDKERLRSVTDIQWNPKADFSENVFDIKLPNGASEIFFNNAN